MESSNLFVLERPNVDHLTVEQIAEQYPPIGWVETFKWAAPEFRLVSHHLQNMGPFYPPKRDMFSAFDLCPLSRVKVLIIGQDPYHGPGQANGMAFSVNRGVRVPPSLANIYKELEQEYNMEWTKELVEGWSKQRDSILENLNRVKDSYPDYYNEEIKKVISRDDLINQAVRLRPVFQRPNHGDLSKWAKQGVLLLNTSLTVSPGQPDSHKGIWNGVIAKVLASVTQVNPECIFLLWGANAHGISEKIGQRTIKLYASHPSPYSANKGSRDIPAFIGSNHFRLANEYLMKQKKEQIDWTLKD